MNYSRLLPIVFHSCFVLFPLFLRALSASVLILSFCLAQKKPAAVSRRLIFFIGQISNLSRQVENLSYGFAS
jgi:hypothetical protein